MRLKSLELQGFKSFPNRTKMNFENGMSVVIGPNGSGKSNIADAIRWVLGELSGKSLRSSKMEDVIFSGTDTRRPMGYAEVSLTFDNTLGEISLPVSYDEVTVTRKYYRSGESEYMINGKNVRLKDITELFMNTGLGKSGYSIIGQGRIAEIISQKSEDRRGIFEEAAGISKYRKRKNEAESKLEKADNNMALISTSLTELGSRVGPLEKDAQKARRYLELYDEKKKIDVGLWLHEIDTIRERSEKLQGDYEIAKHELEMAEDTLLGIERQQELLLQSVRENQEKSEFSHKEYARLSEEKHQADSTVLLLEKDLQHSKDENTRLSLEKEKKSADGKKDASLLAKIEEDHKILEKQKEEYEKNLEEIQNSIEKIRSVLLALEEEKRLSEEEVDRAKELLQNEKIALSALEGSKASEAERRSDLEEQSAELKEKIEKSANYLLKSEENLQAYQKRIDACKEKIGKFQKALEEFSNNEQSLKRDYDNERVVFQTTEERIKLLKRMEEHFEGYAGSVRYVMSKASEGVLKGICGPVSMLLQVEKKYATAIEITLGGSLQNIVTEDEFSAKAAIEALKRSGSGRTTFYPLTNMKPQKIDSDMRKLRGERGFVGIASELVGFEKKYSPVMENLLGKTVICETLDDATTIAKDFFHRFRVVSLDGQVVNAGGSLSGGSIKKESGILTRSAEIEKLSKEKEELASSLEKRKEQLSALSQKKDKVKGEMDSENANLDILNVMFQAENTDCKVRKASLESDRQSLSNLAENLKNLDAQMADYLGKKKEAEERIEEAERTVKKKAALLADADHRFDKENEHLTKEIEEKNNFYFKKTSVLKDLSQNEREKERILEEIALLNSEIAEIDLKKQSLEEKKKQKLAEQKEAEEKIQQLSLEISRTEEADETLKKENEAYEKENEALRIKQKEKTRHREILLREYTKLDGAIEAIKTEQERYQSRLWDEYELTYTESRTLEKEEITEENKKDALQRQAKLKNRIRELGSVNVGAIEEYTDVKTRFDDLSLQYEDLSKSREDLNLVITDLEKEMRARFKENFEEINENFRSVFKELFGGGSAELSLDDPENVLESGIGIHVSLPGKNVKGLSLLSGGEQTFVAIAIFFAILKVNPAPFCLLDEIEAALDEVNVARFAAYAKKFSDKTQFIIISHRRGTMETADTMYGVTMQEKGVSRVLPLHFYEAEEKTGIKFN